MSGGRGGSLTTTWDKVLVGDVFRGFDGGPWRVTGLVYPDAPSKGTIWVQAEARHKSAVVEDEVQATAGVELIEVVYAEWRQAIWEFQSAGFSVVVLREGAA